MDNTILITGASGNIGYETIRGLCQIKSPKQIVAAHYKPEKAKKTLSEFSGLSYRTLDFEKPETFDAALENIDVVFLLRPPHLADIHRYFQPFVQKMIDKGVSKVVFLSVQGVENQKFIPHHKLEKLILAYGLDYVFLRPGYFMQNLTTTLLPEIKDKERIFIPAGKLKMNWVDARDVGLVGAHILNDFNKYQNKSYEITGNEFIGFGDAAQIISNEIGRTITYESPNLLKFYRKKRQQGMAPAMIFVMLMLHYLPRFKKNEPRLANTVADITHRPPIALKEFVNREARVFNKDHPKV